MSPPRKPTTCRTASSQWTTPPETPRQLAECISAGLVPSCPLSERRFDNLGGIVVPVVGCAQHRRLVHVLVDVHRDLDDRYSRSDKLHRVLLLTQPRPDRQAVFFRPTPDFGILFRQALIVSLRHSVCVHEGVAPCSLRVPLPPRLDPIDEAPTALGPHRRVCSMDTLRHEDRSARRASDTAATPLFGAGCGPHIGAFHVKQLPASRRSHPRSLQRTPVYPTRTLD